MWDELYRQHYPELLKYCTASCRDRELAEDLAQETFLKALQNADTFEDLGPSQRRAWLYRTMKNLIIDRYRRALQENLYAQTLEEDTPYIDPGIQQVENEQLLHLLPAEDRAIFVMRHLEGYNASEISEKLGMPPGTVRAKLSRGRKILKAKLEE